MTVSSPDVIGELQERLGYRFRDPALLIQALTHRSYAREQGEEGDNERLEFLGDAVLGLCVADLLYRRSPRDTEGDLSKKRAACVNERCLVDVARALMLGEAIRMGKGEELSGGRSKASLLADTLEAVIGAVYLDGGLDEAKRLVDDHFGAIWGPGGDLCPYRDYKSLLQEICQGRFHQIPQYRLFGEEGPDHDKTFTVRVEIAGGLVEEGRGKSRKEAEQDAARRVLAAWEAKSAEERP